MIVHEAKPHQPHGHFFVCLSHQFDESEEVIRLVKNIIATVTAIKNVVNKTALRCSGCAWHSITITTLATQLKYNVPFLHSCVAFHHDNNARNTVKVQCPLFAFFRNLAKRIYFPAVKRQESWMNRRSYQRTKSRRRINCRLKFQLVGLHNQAKHQSLHVRFRHVLHACLLSHGSFMHELQISSQDHRRRGPYCRSEIIDETMSCLLHRNWPNPSAV